MALSTDRPRDEPCGCARGPTVERAAPRVLLVNVDRALIGLLDTWLAAEGCVVFDEPADSAASVERVDLVVVDVAFPRQGGVDWVRRVAGRHPTAPVLALSSTFFAGIECYGPVARELGVACVLPKPTSREALTQAVRRMLSRAPRG